MKEKAKVIAYIFRMRNNQKELLVFAHRDYPEAGLQVVGGTVEKGEGFGPALVREILEESGLSFLESDFSKIGLTEYHRTDRLEVNHRHYFATMSKELPDKWTHIVSSDGSDNGLLFDFFWLPIHEAQEQLVGNFGELL